MKFLGGIKKIELDLTKYPIGKIFPLVGLNEAGKTTILEAINFFHKNINEGEEHLIIHKKDSGGFSGEIKVTAELEFDEDEKRIIKNTLETNNFYIKDNFNIVSITKYYIFENNNFIESKSTRRWGFIPELLVKTRQAKKYTKLYDKNRDLWTKIILENIDPILPKILYFPDFLFDFPDRIYLENINTLSSKKEQEIQEEYKKVLDDILHKININYSITDFLTKIKSSEESQQTAKETIKQQMASILNREIITPWQEIFPGPGKNILVNVGNDATGYFIKLKIQEGTSSFSINERSLGFRWFFGFILFTEFRKAREGEKGEYLFLFDEPASNLHEGSQQKLLTLFEKLTDKAKIIYSTHSPYLISPKTILNCFIVKDEGRKTIDDYNFRQEINAIPYKNFVVKSSEEETHFKPILDVLEFNYLDFELTDNIVFFEGKFDYYTFKWIQDTYFKDKYNFKLYPGAGVEKYENIFREYLAHNKRFIAVFDADGTEKTKGKGAKNRYINEISQELEKNIFTLKDIDISFDNFTTENLFIEDDKINIQKIPFPASTTYKKSEFNTGIQQLFIENKKITLSNDTKNNFKKVFEFIKEKFNNLDN